MDELKEFLPNEEPNKLWPLNWQQSLNNGIVELPAYKRLVENFSRKGYTLGINDDTIIYPLDGNNSISENITVGHYIGAVKSGNIEFKDVPLNFQTREFFLHSLTFGSEDIIEFVKTHPEKFDKQFYKDHIETDCFSLEKLNVFEYMPLEYIDEELISCAMIKSIKMRYVEERGTCKDWFYDVYKRKPEILTKDFWILGARCFASRINGMNIFLDITPDEYKTEEYYFALCLKNTTKVMEDIPESILTSDFLRKLLDNNIENIICFSDYALEKKTDLEENGIVKFWQMAIIKDSMLIKYIPLNLERIKFFLLLYDKTSYMEEYSYIESRYICDILVVMQLLQC